MKTRRESTDYIETRCPQSAFNGTHVRPMKVCPLREPLLRQPGLRPQLPHPSPERCPEILHPEDGLELERGRT